jgi:putative ABC transport system permease protein
VGGFAVAVALFALLAWVAVRLLRARCPRRARRAGWCWPRGRSPRGRPLRCCRCRRWRWACWRWCCWCCCAPTSSASWRQATPPDAPNRFVINLQPDQGEAFRARWTRRRQRYDWYPMIRGRLVAINGQPVAARRAYSDDRAQRLVEREFNLSHSAALPPHNEWSPAAGRPTRPTA